MNDAFSTLRVTLKDPESIVVIVTRQIGDVLLTTPLIHEARRRWPGARIAVLGFAGTLGVLRGNADVDELIEVAPGAGWRQSWPLIRRLWRRYDLALIAQYTDRAHLYGWVCASERSGQVPEGWKGWWKRALLRHTVALGGDHSHVVLEKVKLLAPWVDSTTTPTMVLPAAGALPDDLVSRVQAGSYVVLQVPSLVRYKQWPLDHYADLGARLFNRGYQVVLTGGPSDADRRMVADVRSMSGVGLVDASGRLDFNQMTTLIHGASLYVGPDTSVTHLAAASGTRVLALFGPIDPRLWGPWPKSWPAEQPYVASGYRQDRGNVVLLQGAQRCVPCNAAGCFRHHDSPSECLESMTVDRVLSEALLLLEGGEPSAPLVRT
ncbi:MAG: glycosyltransferase family 9 protein [Rhizobacter sp.]|nr:glycosyltransferase family 9 protein [Rhizobacter sp.]